MKREDLPSHNIAMTVEELMYSKLHDNQEVLPWKAGCLSMPRLFFGAMESKPEEISAGVPNVGLNPNNFTTLRFRKHHRKGAFTFNRFGKNMIDVSKLKHVEQVPHPHLVAPKLCPRPPLPCYDESLLRVNHYLGSWESYSSRGGYVARTVTDFQLRASINEGEDDDIRPWLGTFVEKLETKRAYKLLEDAGVVTLHVELYQNRTEFSVKENVTNYMVGPMLGSN
mmetsp:Transcript_32513/g.74828  ORF Transcript_32513/g.74828 Transcript_32513/m.74828 type:complete len:225 (+) Transcript_32513:147-821(+)